MAGGRALEHQVARLRDIGRSFGSMKLEAILKFIYSSIGFEKNRKHMTSCCPMEQKNP